jgi:signal transduction histidine kinase
MVVDAMSLESARTERLIEAPLRRGAVGHIARTTAPIQIDRLAQCLAAAEELERRRIAGGLHDEIGPLLAAARLKLTMHRSGCHSASFAATQEVVELLDQVLLVIRRLTFELNPPIRSYCEFVGAVESLCVHVSKHSGLPVAYLSSRTPVPLSSETGQVLYRSARRLLENVVRHARASLAEVRVRYEAGWVEMEVIDDGEGFDPANRSRHFGPDGGFGLYTARAELKSVDGTLRVESVVGRGTQATARVPVLDPHEGTA